MAAVVLYVIGSMASWLFVIVVLVVGLDARMLVVVSVTPVAEGTVAETVKTTGAAIAGNVCAIRNNAATVEYTAFFIYYSFFLFLLN
jgi:hypothetical protein